MRDLPVYESSARSSPTAKARHCSRSLRSTKENQKLKAQAAFGGQVVETYVHDGGYNGACADLELSLAET